MPLLGILPPSTEELNTWTVGWGVAFVEAIKAEGGVRMGEKWISEWKQNITSQEYLLTEID